MTFSFQACVDDDAINKVNRLFNASLYDILNELLQNARRNGATAVTINQMHVPKFGGEAICMVDNGPGLVNPETLFRLGRSAWSSEVIASEDAAGMGFFALANRGALILAQKRGTDRSWFLEASSEAFSGQAPVLGEEVPSHHRGLEVIFPKLDLEDIGAVVRQTARYCPLEATLNGEAIGRVDFLAGAKHIEEWNGIRIGVFHGRNDASYEHNVNFYGVTLRELLPKLHQQFHPHFYVKIDVTHCSVLKLVLPARKEIVQDAFLDQLRMRIKTVFFEMIDAERCHSLSWEDYCEAHALGVELPEAAMMLQPFVPDLADSNRCVYAHPKPVTASAILYLEAEGPVEEQNVARAISKLSEDVALYDPFSGFVGYKWYDALARITLKGYRASVGETAHEIAPDDRFVLRERPDKLEILLEKSDGTATQELCLKTDLFVLSEEYGTLDEADVYVDATSTMTPGELVSFLEASLFSPSDDFDASSYEQQLQWFTDDAEDLAITFLESSTAADVNVILRVLQRELTWRLPKDRDVTIRIHGSEIDVSGLEVAVEAAPTG